MKRTASFLFILTIMASFVIVLGASVPEGWKKTSPLPDFRNFYGIAWVGKPHENLQFARNMKYDYVFYQNGMERDTLSNGLYFYIETPDYLTYHRHLDRAKKQSKADVDFYNGYTSWKDAAAPYPANLATGWFFTKDAFNPVLDYQQQRVIDYVSDSIVRAVKAIEKRNPKFHFGGFAWDVPSLAGDFYDTIQPPGKQITLKHWLGKDAEVPHPGIKIDYSTYSDGHAAYFKELFQKIRKEYPNARFIMEPYKVYRDWFDDIMGRPDARELMPDILSQESEGTDFVDDQRIFATGLIKKDHMCSTTPNRFGERDNRIIAAKAAINGAWFSWFGRIGGTGDMPDFRSIADVPARLKLIRRLPCYENLNGTPLNKRTWDGTTYLSDLAFADPQGIGVLQPGTDNYFVVLLSPDGQVPLPRGRKVLGILKTDQLMGEAGDGSADIVIKRGQAALKNPQGLNEAYIIKLSR